MVERRRGWRFDSSHGQGLGCMPRGKRFDSSAGRGQAVTEGGLAAVQPSAQFDGPQCEDCGNPGVSWEDGVVLCDDCARLRAKRW